jgi:hypothetical protein
MDGLLFTGNVVVTNVGRTNITQVVGMANEFC